MNFIILLTYSIKELKININDNINLLNIII